jgi:hypothetical protein
MKEISARPCILIFEAGEGREFPLEKRFRKTEVHSTFYYVNLQLLEY